MSLTQFSYLYNKIYPLVSQYTMTSEPRVNCLINATEYILKNNIDGCFVECGVWKGGSIMSILYVLSELGQTHKKIYLYDTFDDGMTKPDQNIDISYLNESADCFTGALGCSVDSVKNNISQTKYNMNNITFIKGDVINTIRNDTLPPQIALLRLDTDWYQSTYHELVHLYPRLQQGGVMIIDDYGHWKGCKKAVDQYFGEWNIDTNRLETIDYTGRVFIK